METEKIVNGEVETTTTTVVTKEQLLEEKAELEDYLTSMDAQWEASIIDQRQRLVKIEALLKQL